MNPGTDLRLLIIADDPLARAGVAALLADQAGVHVAGQTGSDADLLAAVAAFAPDLAVWDLGWEPAPALDALSRFCDECGLPVVALLANPSAAAEASAAGAAALLHRTSSGAELAAAARAAAQGLRIFAPDLLPVSPPAPAAASEAAPIELLSPRELDVLRGMAEGLPNKQIARALGISEHTVKFHVNTILGKLHAQSRTEAVVRATRAGLIML